MCPATVLQNTWCRQILEKLQFLRNVILGIWGNEVSRSSQGSMECSMECLMECSMGCSMECSIECSIECSHDLRCQVWPHELEVRADNDRAVRFEHGQQRRVLRRQRTDPRVLLQRVDGDVHVLVHLGEQEEVLRQVLELPRHAAMAWQHGVRRTCSMAAWCARSARSVHAPCMQHAIHALHTCSMCAAQRKCIVHSSIQSGRR